MTVSPTRKLPPAVFNLEYWPLLSLDVKNSDRIMIFLSIIAAKHIKLILIDRSRMILFAWRIEYLRVRFGQLPFHWSLDEWVFVFPHRIICLARHGRLIKARIYIRDLSARILILDRVFSYTHRWLVFGAIEENHLLCESTSEDSN